MSLRLPLTALLLALSGTAALAQSYNAPAGIPPALTPGGLEGRAAVLNLIQAQGGPRYADPRPVDDRVTGSVYGQPVRRAPQR